MTVESAGTPATPRPEITEDIAIELAANLYSVTGSVKELGSQQDRNFRFETTGGRYLLKFANPDFTFAELDAQNIAMARLAEYGIAAPVAISSANGNLLESIDHESGRIHLRLTSFVEGEPLTDTGHLATDTLAELGRLCALTTTALAGIEHPGLDRTLQWDLQQAESVVDSLLDFVPNLAARQRLTDAITDSWRRISAVAGDLRKQPIHGDLTDDNVVAGIGADGRLHPFGVIDLGDVANSWLVGELAITCSSVLHHNPNDPMSVIPVIKAFHQLVPLSEAEVEAIWPMIVARGAVLAVSGEHQVATDPTNDYARNNLPHEWVVFDVACSVPAAVATVAIRDALDMPNHEFTPTGRVKPMLGTLETTVVDLSATSADLNDGAWLRPDAEATLLTKARGKSGMAIARYGEYRLTRTTPLSQTAPANFALHVEVCVPTSSTVVAPLRTHVAATAKDGVVLRTEEFDIIVSGIRPSVEVGAKLKAGAEIGAIARGNRNRVTIQLCTEPDIDPPLFVSSDTARAWQRICPDPTWLLGATASAPTDHSAEILAARNDALASVAHHYYETPPQIERGWRSYLIDTHGRSYLDMCNNVSSIGHSHPRIAEAAEHQWRLLNTNSRFHYSAVAEYATRLASLAPDPLDTVLLVNSGSEAVDLAIRIAQIHTGHRLVVSHAEAYHGWTMASDGVSASTADNPAALTTRPDWTRFLNAPNWYRGTYQGMDSAGSYLADVASAMAGWSAQGGLAAFICEPIFGNGGGIVLPDGYLAGMYELIRSYGGLAIADEVQVGAGRLGHFFWGFEQQGVVPDIITLAKPFGNGHPLGAVITRRDIADSLAEQGNQFSSAGGSPVSCRIGLTVLDVLAEEGLQDNAREVGDYLRARLLELSERHEIIGAVHGMGLYLGLELVRDRQTAEPADIETAAICDRLLELGIIEQPTGDRHNVLKIKPPICLTPEAADYYINTLDQVLTDGW